MQNHYQLFHLPQQFGIDAGALDQAYRDVQGQVHPDRFVNGSDAEKRVAMQWATRANEAYQTLRNPLKRAAYLCELNGIDLQVESSTAMPVAFLMQQMEWRESLDDVRSAHELAALERLDAEVRQAWTAQVKEIAILLDDSNYAAAAQSVRELMFLDKFRAEIADYYEVLDQ
ncbi:Fe-S protein assembly co-chaperone HscB [Actimicrobium sp. CCI2.3]|uniref:Fe-S protein assembly co-chaperone HscB n=1 Tax=Actimicrobium sp. CCI2.3 TaxID=3048616 RepID=UPI002AB44CD0|nr:Fe-S protein assembly co-chaperone HscB [Actimicrobium sp. CCI2.3]MDY7573098.1 Fe-S protein assembly co-chaperone HscB [Actimicrobium sp. CCI2.3]MEB0020895.1 Fe-S protein assembly co-chaperone HscB [Actimicrobium sp. CCI2.3]